MTTLFNSFDEVLCCYPGIKGIQRLGLTSPPSVSDCLGNVGTSTSHSTACCKDTLTLYVFAYGVSYWTNSTVLNPLELVYLALQFLPTSEPLDSYICSVPLQRLGRVFDTQDVSGISSIQGASRSIQIGATICHNYKCLSAENNVRFVTSNQTGSFNQSKLLGWCLPQVSPTSLHAFYTRPNIQRSRVFGV
jgi:hypothetical protein